jgi:antitoxin component of MazEF toxin-antitoxin module
MVEVFEARLRKIGNSLGILVPSKIIEGLGFHKGDVIHVAIPPAGTIKRNEILLELTGIDKKKSSFKREKEDRY